MVSFLKIVSILVGIGIGLLEYAVHGTQHIGIMVILAGFPAFICCVVFPLFIPQWSYKKKGPQ